MSSNTPSAVERADLEARLNRTLSLVRRLDTIERELDSTKQQYRLLARPAPHVGEQKPWGTGSYWVWVGVLFGAWVLIGVPLVSKAWGAAQKTFYYNSDLYGFVFMVSLGALAASFGLAWVIRFVRNRFVLRRRNAQVARTNQQIEQRNAQVAESNRGVEMFNAGIHNRLLQLDDQRNDVAVGLYEIVADRYPMTYLYDEAVGFCLQMVRDHRADTVGEALNLYETELHRRRLENLAQAQVAEQHRATQMAMLGNIINAAGHAATAATVRSQGEANRQAAQSAAAATQRTIRDEAQKVRDQAARPVRIR
jgi:hypothetical protein